MIELEENLEIILLLAIPIVFIVGIFIFVKISLFFMDMQLKSSKGSMIKIYNHDDLNELKKSHVVHQKLVIKDKDGNIIKEVSSNNGEDNILDKLMDSTIENSDGVIRDEFGNKIIDFGSQENFEELKNKIVNDNNVIKRTMAVSITKDHLGNVVVRDRNGNKLEGDAKKEALEIFEKARSMNGQETKKAKLTPEQERMNEQYLESVERQKAENRRLQRLKEEIRLEAKNLMNNNPVGVLDDENIVDEDVIKYNDEDDECGIEEY